MALSDYERPIATAIRSTFLTARAAARPETHTADNESDGTPPRLLERAPTLADVGNAAAFAASDQHQRSPPPPST